jgi:hypothetical protein
MLRSETHFEQVPLEIVKKITQGQEAEETPREVNKHQQLSKDTRPRGPKAEA